MNAKQQVKELVKDAFPSVWLQWHFMKRPKSAERELSYLDKVIPDDAVTVDVGANCGLYTRRLARLSRQVHAFEPSQQMARLLRRTSARNVSVHEIALSDHDGDAELFIPQGDDGLVYGLASLEARADPSATAGLCPCADRAARCGHRPGRGVREDRRRRPRVECPERRRRTSGALPAGVSGGGGRPPSRRGDALGVRILPEQILSGLLPERQRRDRAWSSSIPTGFRMPVPCGRTAAARTGSSTSTTSFSFPVISTVNRY